MQYFGYILLSLVILLLMVLIHELGHYTMAKIFGFTVDEFSIGFGPKLFSHRRKNGELFSVRLLPLGGYCAFLGETEETPAEKQAREQNKTEQGKEESKNAAVTDGEVNTNASAADVQNHVVDTPVDSVSGPANEKEDLLSYVMRTKPNGEDNVIKTESSEKVEAKPVRLDKNGNPAKTFNEQAPWKRILVLLGGVLFNFISAFIFSFVYICAVGNNPVVIERYENPEGAAYAQELNVDDIILKVDGQKISVMNPFSTVLEGYEEGDEITLTVKRDGEIMLVTVVKQKIEQFDEEGRPLDSYVGLGIRNDSVHGYNPVAEAFTYFVPFTFRLSWSIIGSFGNILIGKEKITNMTGPVGSITSMASLSQASWKYTLMLLPLLASNLAIFNILPIPALDGAHIVFTIIEWIRKKPIPRKIENMIHSIGLIVLLVFVAIVDILSFVL